MVCKHHKIIATKMVEKVGKIMENTIKNLSEILSVNAKDYAVKNAITAEVIGVENFRQWKNLCHNVLKACYECRRVCRVNGGEIDYTPLYDSMKVVFSMLGKVNGHALTCEAGTATEIMAWTLKLTTVYDNTELGLLRTQIGNDRRTLSSYEGKNGIKAETIEALKKSIEEKTSKYDEMMEIAGNAHKEATIVSEATFRKSFEKFLGDRINGQLMKTYAQLEAEAEARKAEKKARHMAKKALNTTENK